MTFSPGSVFVLALVLMTGCALWIFSGVENRRFLLALFLVGFLVRAAISLSLDAVACGIEGGPAARRVIESPIGIIDRTRIHMQISDSDYYSQRGYAWAQHAKGFLKSIPPYYSTDYGWNGYLHVVASFYYLFDFSPTSVKFLNCFFGALLGPAIFFLAKACFNLPTARWASLIVSFFPSLVLWSATNLKEPLFFLLTVLLFLFFFRIQNSSRWRTGVFYGCLFAGVFLLHAIMRSAIYSWTMVACSFGAVFFTSRVSRFRKWIVFLILLAGVFVGQNYIRSFLIQAYVKHAGHIWTWGTVYKYLPEELYDSNYTVVWTRSSQFHAFQPMWIGKAVFRYLLEPFPSRINTLRVSMSFPQMVFWYFSLPFAFFGMAAACRRDIRCSLFMVLTLMVWTVVTALTSGNIGTVLRIRDMLTPFYLLFACVGIRVFLYGRKELSHAHC